MTLMLNHVDSPYIRCIGFLYLRYGSNPTDIWDRFRPFLYDEEPVRTSSKTTQKEITVGKYVRNLLTDMEYCGTLLPRLPVAVERDIKVKLMQVEKIEERALRHLQDKKNLPFFEKIGSRIQALYGDEDNPVTWYDAIVDRVIRTDDETGAKLARPKFKVTFPEYGNTELVSLGEIDTMQESNYESRDQIRTVENENFTNHTRSDTHRCINDRNQYHDNDRYKRNRDGDQDCSSGSNGNRGYDHAKRTKHYASGRGSYVPNEKDLMEEVLQRERDKSAAKGRAYASRPATFKESLSASRHGVEVRKDIGLRYERPTHGKRCDNEPGKALLDNERDQTNGRVERKQKTAEEMGAIAEKKRQLLARYG